MCVQYLDLQTKHVTHEDKQIIVTHEQHGIMNIHHTYQSICRNAETISRLLLQDEFIVLYIKVYCAPCDPIHERIYSKI